MSLNWIRISRMFILSPVSETQMSFNQPRDASSKGRTERQTENMRLLKRQEERWRNKSREMCCYIKHKEGKPHFTHSDLEDTLSIWRDQFCRQETPPRVICSKWNIILHHVNVLWVVIFMYAKSDQKKTSWRGTPGFFSKHTDIKKNQLNNLLIC